MTKEELKKLTNELYLTPIIEMEDFITTVFYKKFNSNWEVVRMWLNEIAKDETLESEIRGKLLGIVWFYLLKIVNYGN